MPASILAAPNHFRISLTASDAMVDRAVGVLADVGVARVAA
jgi:hypothetical protein